MPTIEGPVHPTDTLAPEPTELQKRVATSPKVAAVLSDEEVRRKIEAILAADDPMSALQQALSDDPSIERVAETINNIMDNK
ncbi:hypothetical protein PSACC_02061 [Paramicrosporidium saccamoebae]|uniref:Uncharacterized protein n=1 Tax=Paramicrosporidium saccamoebae TaxID=1246581 RepID=A0A2H9TK43_9FUNG|nr:hypothetical protein PSACC_02061 [Paramicrosporidium saccamoebae]